VAGCETSVCFLIRYATVSLSFPFQDMSSSPKQLVVTADTKQLVVTADKHYWEWSLIHSAKRCSQRSV